MSGPLIQGRIVDTLGGLRWQYMEEFASFNIFTIDTRDSSLVFILVAILMLAALYGGVMAMTGHDHSEAQERCRVFVYPFSARRIQPFGIRRKVPEFLKTNGVETDTWRQAWNQLNESIGEYEEFRWKLRFQVVLCCVSIGLGAWGAYWTHLQVCGYILELLSEDTPADYEYAIAEEDPFLAICFGAVYETCILYFLVKRQSVLDQESNKILLGILNKVRYACHDLEENGRMYFLPRVNYDLRMIVVDVFKSREAMAALLQIRTSVGGSDHGSENEAKETL